MWDGLGTVIPIGSSSESSATDTTEQGTSDANIDDEHDGVDNGDSSMTWHDVALSIAAELMGKIRRDIHERLGYSTSAASGKVVARRGQ